MLQYLSSNAWFDIKMDVNQVSCHTRNPKLSHDIVIQRICCYLKGNRYKGLIFKPTNVLNMDFYVDDDSLVLWHIETPEELVSVNSFYVMDKSSH